MLNEDVLRDLASKPYDAALGHTSWSTVLSAFSAAFSATKSTLLSQELNERHAAVLDATGFDADAQRTYEAYYRRRNVLIMYGKRFFVSGLVRTNEMMVPDDLLLKSEYYNDYLRVHDVRYTLGTTVTQFDQEAIHLTLFRPKKAGAYGNEEIRALTQLVPHFQRALQIHERIAASEQQTTAMAEALERCGRGVALLDGRGRPLFVNTRLETMVKAGDGLLLTTDHLSVLAPESTRALHTLIANATRRESGGTIAVLRPSGAPPYSVVVSPVSKRAPLPTRAAAAVLVVVSDPASSVHVDLKLLQTAYGLTLAEARIASRLGNGATITAIAEQLRISLSTARTHLKRILHKTGTCRQSELVRLVLLTQ